MWPNPQFPLSLTRNFQQEKFYLTHIFQHEIFFLSYANLRFDLNAGQLVNFQLAKWAV